MKNAQELHEITYYCDMQFTGETIAHVKLLVSHSIFKQVLGTPELAAIAPGGGYKIIIVVKYYYS